MLSVVLLLKTASTTPNENTIKALEKFLLLQNEKEYVHLASHLSASNKRAKASIICLESWSRDKELKQKATLAQSACRQRNRPVNEEMVYIWRQRQYISLFFKAYWYAMQATKPELRWATEHSPRLSAAFKNVCSCAPCDASLQSMVLARRDNLTLIFLSASLLAHDRNWERMDQLIPNPEANTSI